jgi:hypothetical protein
VRRILVGTVVLPLSVAALALTGGLMAGEPSPVAPPTTATEAEESVSAALEEEIAQARIMLTDLFISERIDQIDFRAETYADGMAQVHAAVDRILEERPDEPQKVPIFADHARQIIEALNGSKRRGLAITYGKDVKMLIVLTPGDGRLLGEVVGTTLSIIREEFGESDVSYFDPATKLFHSIVLDTDEGPLLGQYVDGVRLVAELPPPRRTRYLR